MPRRGFDTFRLLGRVRARAGPGGAAQAFAGRPRAPKSHLAGRWRAGVEARTASVAGLVGGYAQKLWSAVTPP